MKSLVENEAAAGCPRVSVVLPTRNSEAYVQEAIDSVLSQTFSNFELIVVDDGSTDKTLSILARNQETDSRILVIPGPGKGLAAALNAGMLRARGEFIARIDADDIARDTRFQKQVDLLDANPDVGVCGTLFQEFVDGNYLYLHMEKVRFSDLLQGCYIGHPTAMFRRGLFVQHELFYNENFRCSEDYELWSRAIRVTKFANVPENLLWYRRHSKSASVVHNTAMVEVDLAIKLDMIDFLVGGIPEDLRKPLKATINNTPVPEADRQALVAKLMSRIRFPELCSQIELLSYFHQLKEFDDDALRHLAADTLKHLQFFVISYNHLTYVQSIVEFFRSVGAENVNIIDNASTYKPLIDYLEDCPYRVYYMHKNYGHMVLFECPVFQELVDNNFFVLTDPDILPISDCPDDYLLKFLEILLRFPMKNKVGFSLKIDDLPDHYALKENVILWEKRFYDNPLHRRGVTIYDADVDTTFALYRPRREWRTSHFFEAFRVGSPYTARHLPWYRNLQRLSDEEQHYIQNDRGSSNWNGTLSSEDLHRKYGTLSCEHKDLPQKLTITLDPAWGDVNYQQIIIVKALRLLKQTIRVKQALLWPFKRLRDRQCKQLKITENLMNQL